MTDELQDKLPGNSVEKASKAELSALLERQEAFAVELELQQSLLGMLRQQALSMLQHEATLPSGEEPAILQQITAMQDQCIK